MNFFIECGIDRCEYSSQSKKDIKHHTKTEHCPRSFMIKWWFCNQCEKKRFRDTTQRESRLADLVENPAKVRKVVGEPSDEVKEKLLPLIMP